ncbi:ABC transporter substrate-binding protein [Cryptosporangium aurantiacum]|uniref:Osmoprotectant transport system substrate-binding protein n=1 Tax=Cryptosporangium aurantiacum TaxID=134849 RepID=A0A1M7PTH2_9ACTN|nr:ABC transporter substrate-binding protein [Cryptosporangium aurantiacum]SHN20771.1 osmoprotectant transport system substrate-binding protein [Cryptosporangium aurantiacum]
MRKNLRMLFALSSAAALLALSACGGGDDDSGDDPLGSSANGGEVVVGSANFQENVLLGEIYAQALEAKDVKVKRQLNIGAREVIYSQIEKGSLTVLPEYNGALLAYLDKTATATTSEEVDAALKTKLPSGLELLNPSEAEDKDSVVVTKETAAKYNLKSLEDLAPVAKDLVIGGPPEFKTRVQGIVGLKDKYGAEFKSFKSLDVAGPITVSALKKGDVQAANLFTTDPAVPANEFVVLEDPKGLFSAQNVTPLVNKEGVNDTVRDALNAVSAKLDTATLAELVKKVVSDKQDVDTVAKEWLSSAGLV